MNGNINVFTDGSCKILRQGNIGSWVAIIFINEARYTISGFEENTTHNRMELLAVIKAIEFVFGDNKITNNLIIFSDSQYVVQLKDRKNTLIENNFLTGKGTFIQNCDLVKILLQKMEDFPLTFIKVKAHKKKEKIQNFNREADILARKMVRSYLIK